jgi:ATP-dependent protease Clp ATPase subunit
MFTGEHRKTMNVYNIGFVVKEVNSIFQKFFRYAEGDITMNKSGIVYEIQKKSYCP